MALTVACLGFVFKNPVLFPFTYVMFGYMCWHVCGGQRLVPESCWFTFHIVERQVLSLKPRNSPMQLISASLLWGSHLYFPCPRMTGACILLSVYVGAGDLHPSPLACLGGALPLVLSPDSTRHPFFWCIVLCANFPSPTQTTTSYLPLEQCLCPK